LFVDSPTRGLAASPVISIAITIAVVIMGFSGIFLTSIVCLVSLAAAAPGPKTQTLTCKNPSQRKAW
jgi:hypothetical protein